MRGRHRIPRVHGRPYATHDVLVDLIDRQAIILAGFTGGTADGWSVADMGDDDVDAYYAATTMLARLVAFYRDDDLDGFAAWIDEPAAEWYAVGGDVRWVVFPGAVAAWEAESDEEVR